MIIKTYPNKSLYGKYFLAIEAPDDETVTKDQPKPRRNVKVISVKPSNRRKDFTEVDDEPETVTPEEQPAPETTEDTPEQTDAADAEPAEANQPTPETSDNQTETADEGPDTEGTEDFTSDDNTTDTSGDDTGETGEEGPDTEGTEDFAAGAEDETETQPQQQTNDTAPPADATKANAPGVDLDSMRKYNLFKEFMSLYNACNNYISKLENILRNDYEENQIIRISVNNLREIKDILSDYMTIRFQINSYIQSLLFYQKMVISVQLVFNLLKSINPNNKT